MAPGAHQLEAGIAYREHPCASPASTSPSSSTSEARLEDLALSTASFLGMCPANDHLLIWLRRLPHVHGQSLAV